MALSERIRQHLQGNVVGYVALFVALSGTALALPGHKTVKSDDLANGAVKSKAIADGSVKTTKIGNAAVTSGKLADASVTPQKVAASAVGATALADGAVTSAKLADDSVIRQKIAQGEVNGGKLANGAVNSAKVADGTLLAEDFAAGQLSDGFAVSGTPNFSGGTVVPNTLAPYNAPRSGRLLLNASMFANVGCSTACEVDIALFVDGNYVPNSTRVLGATIGGGGGNERTQPTTSGIVQVAAGAHTIEIRAINFTADTFSASNQAITGILLQ
jgi:hypothetical protein